jgi:SAM-dependent methyltransferase
MSLSTRLDDLATRTIISSRDAKWRLYEQVFPPRRRERVLDVGVSSLVDLPGENYFLRRYPFPGQLTGVGISDLSGLSLRYPGVTFVQADGRELPFEDDEFDVVHSNAVVEHVGPRNDQARFIAELVRVAKRGLITTPNRWFPLESHVRLPLVHWLPRPATLALLRPLGHEDWPVWLLSRSAFRALFPPYTRLTIRAQKLGGWPAVFLALFSKV